MEAGKLKSVTQTISLIVGLALIVMGLVGFLFPSLSGLHLSNFHCAIMAISGGTLFYNAFKDNDRDLFISCLCFGIYFALHAVAGFAFANSVNSSSNPELLRMIPNFTELGIVDHILNGIIGIMRIMVLVMNLTSVSCYRVRPMTSAIPFNVPIRSFSSCGFSA